ncbi:MAG: hypothetical protein WBH50_25815, partial [Fuerstiella sp.]
FEISDAIGNNKEWLTGHAARYEYEKNNPQLQISHLKCPINQYHRAPSWRKSWTFLIVVPVVICNYHAGIAACLTFAVCRKFPAADKNFVQDF